MPTLTAATEVCPELRTPGVGSVWERSVPPAVAGGSVDCRLRIGDFGFEYRDKANRQSTLQIDNPKTQLLPQVVLASFPTTAPLSFTTLRLNEKSLAPFLTGGFSYAIICGRIGGSIVANRCESIVCPENSPIGISVALFTTRFSER